MHNAQTVWQLCEATQLAGFSQPEAAKIFIKPAGIPANIRLRPQSPDDAEASFLRAFLFSAAIKSRRDSQRILKP